MSILDEIPQILADAAGDVLFKDAKLTRAGKGTGPAWEPGQGASQSWFCKGLVSEWGSFSKAGGLVAGEDRKVVILAATLPTTPKVGDRITIEGVGYTVSSDGGSSPAVQSDPANATWTCRAKG